MLQKTELSEARRALLDKYLRGTLSQTITTIGAIPRRSAGDPAPLSFGQEQLWFLAQLMPDSPVYNSCFTISFAGSLDVPALEQSLNEFIGRHEAWRTSFPSIDGQPVQLVHSALSLKLPVVDLRYLSETERESEAQRLAIEDARRPFDLTQVPLLRVILVRLDDERYRLFLTMHHIISDGVSLYQIFLPELHALYEAFTSGRPSPLSPLPIQYADFAAWERKSEHKDKFAKQLTYWKRQLADAPQVLNLPTDRPRPPVQTYSGSIQTFALSRKLTDALKTLSRQESVTLYMTMAAAFETLLYRYTGQDDFLLGTITSTRKQSEVQNVAGYLLNTLVLRADMTTNPSFYQLLKRVREVVIAARHHEDIPFENVVKALQPERSLSYHPLFQVMLAYQPQLPSLPPGWTISQTDVQTYTSKFDLILDLEEQPQGLIGCFTYNSDLFEEATIARMVGHWQMLLEGIVADPEQPVAALPLLTEPERQQLLVDWNQTQAPSPELYFPELFAQQVERTPDAIAVVFEGRQLTYRELNARANQLAHYLQLQHLGVRPGTPIGICVERSLEMVIGLLGILKAGGVYVPLDPAYPAERLAFLVQDTQMPVLLTQHSVLSQLPAQAARQTRLICLDRDGETIWRQSVANPEPQVQADQPAYVIYTSGSTGQPKGVLISHQALATHCWSITQVYELHAQDRVLQFSAFTFDASLEQVLPTLLVGATVVVRGPELWSSAELLKQIHGFGLTVINLPPAYWQQMLREWTRTPGRLLGHHLRLVIVGGDRLVPEMLQLWRQLPLQKVRLLNAYGPTETVITSTLCDLGNLVEFDQGIADCECLPIGRPLPNRKAYILDRWGHPVPIGVAGELHLGGPLLAQGYLNQPELTAQRFIADPFSSDSQARLYKTGDRARYRPDGTIEFLGRLDHQVKVRGFRIELGEIEAALRQHPDVGDVVVVAREDTPGETELVAYVVGRQGRAVESTALRQYLKQKLPTYMLPAAFVPLQTLPLLPTGKLDRRALPAPQPTKLTEDETFVAPRQLIHQQLVQIWEELLDARPIGIRDNFFYLGGHSLLAARLVDRIEHVLARRIALSTLFSGPTIEQLADALQQQENVNARTSLLPVQTGGSKRPFFFLHGDWTGGAFYCFTLARALGSDQPFYVLEPYKFGGLQTLPSFEEIATAHIESIRAVQPKGPYLLGGFCNGGLLAYEMARQLEAAGERVDFLALINPSVPVQFTAMRTLGNRIGKSLRLGVNKQAALFLQMRHAFRHVYRHLYPSGSRVQDFGQLLAIDPRLKAMFPPVEALHNDYVGAFTWLVSQYETGIYSGKITFYWASEEPGAETTWHPVTQTKDREDIENHVVPGTHMSCVSEHIQELAQCLSACLSRAQQETSNPKV